LLENLPDAEFIVTSNAESNETMLNINHEMGFKPYKTATPWQIDVDSVSKYLAKRAVLPPPPMGED